MNFQSEPREIPLPPDSYIDYAALLVEHVPPTEEQQRRGDFRQDIQSALTSVQMPGGIFGSPRPVYASRDVGAQWSQYYYIMCSKRLPAMQFMDGSATPPQKFMAKYHADWYDPRYMDDPREKARMEARLVRLLREAEKDLRALVAGFMDEHQPPLDPLVESVLPFE